MGAGWDIEKQRDVINACKSSGFDSVYTEILPGFQSGVRNQPCVFPGCSSDEDGLYKQNSYPESGYLKCDKCGFQGDVFQVVMEIRGLQNAEALEYLYYDYFALKTRPKAAKPTRQRPYFHECKRDEEKEHCREKLRNGFLNERAITEEGINRLDARLGMIIHNYDWPDYKDPKTNPHLVIGFPYRKLNGGEFYVMRSLHDRKFPPKKNGEKPTKAIQEKKPQSEKVSRYGVLGSLDGEIVFLSEGEPDTAAIASQIPDTTKYSVFSIGGHATKLKQQTCKALSGKTVISVYDNDEESKKRCEEIANFAENVIVKDCNFKQRGCDLEEWFQAGNTFDDLLTIVEATTEFSRTKKPLVEIKHDESKTNKEVIMALSNLGWSSGWVPEDEHEKVRIYTRADHLVSVQETDNPNLPKGICRIRILPEVIVRERITQACQLWQTVVTKDGDEIRYVHPPRHLCQQIHQRGDYGGHIKPLNGIVQAPTIRKDGSILQTAGYDELTGLIYKPISEFPTVPDEPTPAQVQAAIDALLHVVVDFPFKTDSDKSAWLSMVFSMIARQCIDGCVPMFCLTANIRGAGKSMLVDCASIIAYGRPAARRAFTPDNDEMRKAITTIAIEADPCVLLDNIDTTIRGASLDAALTSQTWKDRILGKSQSTAELPLKTIWAATGNNLSYGSDIGRRVLPIRLESQLESPEEREGFVHDDLLRFVGENRPNLAVAAITIIRAYFNAGSPKQSNGQFGSFEFWSDIIRGALVWSGQSDPLETRVDAKASDESADALSLLIGGLLEADQGDGLSAKQIENMVSLRSESNQEELRYPTLAEAIGLVCGGRLTTRSVGNQLKRFRGRMLKNMRIMSKNGRANVKLWSVEKLDSVSLVSLPRQESKRSFSNESDSIAQSLPTRERAEQTNHTNLTNQSVEESTVCPNCNSEMKVVSEPVDGWINFDCVECDFVQPKQVEELVN